MMTECQKVLIVGIVVVTLWTRGCDMTKRDDHVDNVLRGHQCSMFFYADPFLWRQIYGMEGGNISASYSRILSLLHEMIDEANEVYSSAEFYGYGRVIHRGIKFYLADYHIDNAQCHFTERDPFGRFSDCQEHTTLPISDLCRNPINCSSSTDDNLFCNDVQSMRFYLHLFSMAPPRDLSQFCLAYAITYRQMTDFQGMAWIKAYSGSDPKSLQHYGYCAQMDPDCVDPHSSFSGYMRNTGVINLQAIPDYYSEDVAKNIFVHELGHSLGSLHDGDETRDDGCDYDSSHLMTSDAKKILLGNVSFMLSACSMNRIGRNLDRVTCWDERKGPKPKSFQLQLDFQSHICDYLQREDEKKECLRMQMAKSGLIITLAVASTLVTFLIVSVLLLRIHQLIQINHQRKTDVTHL